MATVAECIKRAQELRVVSDSARLDIELLLGHVLKKDRTWLFTWPESLLSSEQSVQFDAFFKRRLNGEPVAHILGEKEFWSLPLFVDTSTLIPRPDTELLVETVLELAGEKKKILDLGTGTGAIALALASELPTADILAVDRSLAAVQLAQRNRERLGFANVVIRQSDWFLSVENTVFDIIVSNPPYIEKSDLHLLQGDVVFEPVSALVAGDSGLADIGHIIKTAIDYLTPGGTLMLEHGWQQANEVQALFRQKGYQKIETRKDLGGNDRVTFALSPE
ncbi:peptide chain release factor N(5)-glutamine methyltransferase [Teredinibacter haidensis]|uniref:peptide chain release factor N(5)-glutamine methyltransferase n=1 Tax=Teredinibacter haidensis TaxID=2731755 RepID=UPI000948D755|nr:peptide chain release factor N(5)-glutamine methyltransferase [Teredinibacter haidensis]